MRRAPTAAAVGTLAVVAGLAGPAGAGVSGGSGAVGALAAARPNIVVIMVDDMSAELVDYMDEVSALRSDGVNFRNYFVSNSLCCPSRATYLTGKYPHNSRVRANYWPKGGVGQFMQHDENTSVGPHLSAAGYRTGLIGKYLNEYEPAGDTDGVGSPDYPAAYVPPGWDEWFAAGGDAYQHFDYSVVDSVDGDTSVVDFAGAAAGNYLTDVMSDRAGEFIDRAADGAEPFFLTLTPYAVHGGGGGDPQEPDGPRFPPAPRDRADSPNRPAGWGEPQFENGDCGSSGDGGCDEVAYPDPRWGSFNQPITDPANHSPTEPLPPETIDEYDVNHTERVQMAQAVNGLIGAVRDDLADAGVAGNTYIVFTSDNGFHLGEHALSSGKATPYDHDARVPLVIRPPGGTARTGLAKVAQNTDLLPTLLDIADAEVPSDVDGRSLLPLVDGTVAGKWRRTAFMEYAGHQGKPKSFAVDPDTEPGTEPDTDPDAEPGAPGDTPRYVALRTRDYLYVDYSRLDSTHPRTGRAEYFDLSADPYMIHNTFDDLRRARRVKLNDAAIRYETCAGSECWDVGRSAP